MQFNTKVLTSCAIVALSAICGNSALADQPQAYRVTGLQGDVTCFGREISNLSLSVGQTIYVYGSLQAGLTLTDSTQSTVAFVTFPVGHEEGSSVAGGPGIVIDGNYSAGTLQVKESDTDGYSSTSAVTQSGTQLQIVTMDVWTADPSLFSRTGTCTFEAVN